MKSKTIARKAAYYILSLLFFVLIVLVGCKNTAQPESQEQTSEEITAIQNGEVLYKEYCSGCHGSEIGAFVDRSWQFGSSDDNLYESISDGRTNDGMPAFGDSFSEKDISDIIAAINNAIENAGQYSYDNNFSVTDTFNAGQFRYTLEEVASGFGSPWGMAFLPDNSILITDKSGELFIVYPNGNKEEIEGVPPVVFQSQGGLLDVEVHPDFSTNNWLYLSYSKYNDMNRSIASTAVSRFRLEGNQLTDEKLIFEAEPYTTTRHHYGSRLEFDKSGFLYISVGDRGRRDVYPQDLTTAPGKIHRVTDNGEIPSDNPFFNTPDVIASIYSYGHRNQQGMIKHPVSGKIWSHEHGPKGGDEINIIAAGLNYGWPVISYGINYDGSVFTELTEKEGMEQPLHYWVPSIAPCGMTFISGDKYPGWEGDLLIGSLKYRYLNLCRISGETVTSEELLLQGIGRLRNVKQGNDNYIYIAVESPGRIYKISPVN